MFLKKTLESNIRNDLRQKRLAAFHSIFGLVSPSFYLKFGALHIVGVPTHSISRYRKIDRAPASFPMAHTNNPLKSSGEEPLTPGEGINFPEDILRGCWLWAIDTGERNLSEEMKKRILWAVKGNVGTQVSEDGLFNGLVATSSSDCDWLSEIWGIQAIEWNLRWRSSDGE